MKKLVYILSLSLFIASFIFPVGAFAGENTFTSGHFIEADTQGLMDNARLTDLLGNDVVSQMQEQALAVEAYNYLMDKFTDENGTIVYPDHYGGEFIEDGNLIILLANTTEDERNSYLNQLANYKSVIQIRDVEYSINELNSFAEKAINNMDASIRKSFYIDPRSNQVVITIPQVSLDSITIPMVLKDESLQSLPITFEAEKELTPTSLIGGDGLVKFGSLVYHFTLGVCGTYGGYPAVLTAGHDWVSGDTVTYEDYENIGSIVKVPYVNNGTGDYAIARITNAAYPTTNLVRSSSSNTYQIKGKYSLPVGGLGYRYGAESGLQALEVTAINKQETYGGKTINGMTETKHISGSYAINGDSGGPYYAMNLSSNWCIVGTTAAAGATGANQVVVINPIGNVSGFTVKTN